MPSWRFVRWLLGERGMTKVQDGKTAPNFALPLTDGTQCSLADALKKGPVVAAFFKISCPVCQFTFPFLQRLYETYGDDRATIWGISQDDARDTREFAEEFGVKFPALIDGDGYPASNLYGITNVPSVFLIAPNGNVLATSIGFDKAALEKMAAELARSSGKPTMPLFLPSEVVPDFKPG
jgi:peroxiredoxin